MDYFETSLDHLHAELERIDLLIRARVAQLRRLQSADDQFHGLYISEEEVDRLLHQPAGAPGWMAPDAPGLDLAALQTLRERIDARTRQSRAQGVVLALDRLRESFGLSAIDVDILLICLAVELEPRYERLYGYLQDDITRRRPGVDLVLKLLAPTSDDRLGARARLTLQAPLRRQRLVWLVDDPAHPHPTLLARTVKVDERIVNHLLGFDGLDEGLRRFARLDAPDEAQTAGALDAGADDIAARLRTLIATGGKRVLLYFHGPHGSGKQALAHALCREQGLALLVADLPAMLAQPDLAFGEALALALREARLQRAASYWTGFEVLTKDAHCAQLAEFLRRHEGDAGLVFLSGELPWTPAEGLQRMLYRAVAFARPGIAARMDGWRAALDAYPGTEDLADLPGMGMLANTFTFTRGQIRAAAATAFHLASWREPAAPRIALADLHEACRAHSNQTLSALARKITPRFGWDDIVLPADRMTQLREICNYMTYRHTVYEAWGFDDKLGLGKGLTVLFAGPSGTGKTMSAEIVAKELGLDLFKIDVASVISKYIGETEKNLGRIFSEAETSNAILFFDEADALFGKRSEVRDSHDRYANIEVSYLLQRMEEYEGIAVLATNFRKNMDEAFVRRLHATIEFPAPGEEERLRIWSGIWPTATPLDPDLDLHAIAHGFELTGGNIRNIALAAAFLAAGEGGAIAMRHIDTATRREYQKMGKLMGTKPAFTMHDGAIRRSSHHATP